MILIGAGQGGALGPLTAARLAGVAPEDAGAAGGVTNVAHQIGGSLGLAVLVAVFAAAGSSTLHGAALLAHRISAALTVGAVVLALALVIALIVRPRKATVVADTDPVTSRPALVLAGAQAPQAADAVKRVGARHGRLSSLKWDKSSS